MHNILLKIIFLFAICALSFSSCINFSKKADKKNEVKTQPVKTQPVKLATEVRVISPNPFPFDLKKVKKPQISSDLKDVQTNNIKIKPKNEKPKKKETPLKEDTEEELRFHVGEKIIYDIKMWNGRKSAGRIKGTASFEIREGIFEEKNCYIFNGIAKGEGFGYKLKIDSVSYIERETLLPVETINIQTGTEKRKKKLVFSDDTIEYIKLKHCKNFDSCEIEEHFIETDDGAKEHCRKCRDQNHYIWRVRASLKNKKPTYDLLSALFIARNFPLKVGEKSGEIRLADGRDLWLMSIYTKREEIVESKAGKFETIMLKLTTRPINVHAMNQKSFKGLFGLKGDIVIWIDKKTKIPIKIHGSYPLIFDIPIEILLKSIEGRDLET